ncbi:MAG: hypothetical protein MK085_06535, partial [Phycisphaerales bacterium]|nr:hypothetical protein [Phycisphaerales bacterium]
MDRTLRQSLTRITRPVLLGGVFAAGLGGVFIAPTSATPTTGVPAAVHQASGKDSAKLVDDFLHYLLIAKPDLAEASGRALFDSGITNEELAETISENDLGDKVERAIQRGRGMAGVGPMVTSFEERLEEGRLGLARSQDRVREAIDMLTGTMRAQMLGKRRLVEAGEYAVPELLRVLVKGNNPQLELAVTGVLSDIKRQAVLPLCAALPELPPSVQVKVCRILATIGWPTAIPYLLETMQATRATKDVKDAAMQAFRRLGGTSTDASSAFAALSRKFFDEEQSLIAYPGDATNIVWSYGPHSGLVPTLVPTNIYAQVMAMQTARKSLDYQSDNRTALALFVAADLRRENQLGADQTDP